MSKAIRKFLEKRVKQSRIAACEEALKLMQHRINQREKKAAQFGKNIETSWEVIDGDSTK
jgi:hypothetical protein